MDKGCRLFVGMDVGDRRVALMSKGRLVEESRLATTGTALTRKSARIEPSRMALEVGSHSHWIRRTLRQLGHDMVAVVSTRMSSGRSATRRRTNAASGPSKGSVNRADRGGGSPCAPSWEDRSIASIFETEFSSEVLQARHDEEIRNQGRDYGPLPRGVFRRRSDLRPTPGGARAHR